MYGAKLAGFNNMKYHQGRLQKKNPRKLKTTVTDFIKLPPTTA